jgi:hypothetical protein
MALVEIGRFVNVTKRHGWGMLLAEIKDREYDF